ncbi:apolipoprotein C-IV [Toxotes jaculatrix]|uniref:apolipoprotein C-IV n=1 Tax=Toxotes jaculatrix TaxID=941984 RepID=UPI001B3ABBFE|nr:apolipoprotein C-IV [Toxotes jaculatrix]
MHTKVFVFGLILLIQACGPLLAETPTLGQTDSPGMMQRLLDRARNVKAKAQDIGGIALGFVGAYYEDHIQPVTDSYAEWASNVKSSMWNKIQTTIDNYMPFN